MATPAGAAPPTKRDGHERQKGGHHEQQEDDEEKQVQQQDGQEGGTAPTLRQSLAQVQAQVQPQPEPEPDDVPDDISSFSFGSSLWGSLSSLASIPVRWRRESPSQAQVQPKPQSEAMGAVPDDIPSFSFGSGLLSLTPIPSRWRRESTTPAQVQPQAMGAVPDDMKSFDFGSDLLPMTPTPIRRRRESPAQAQVQPQPQAHTSPCLGTAPSAVAPASVGEGGGRKGERGITGLGGEEDAVVGEFARGAVRDAYKRAVAVTKVKWGSTDEAFSRARKTALTNQSEIEDAWRKLASLLRIANHELATENAEISCSRDKAEHECRTLREALRQTETQLSTLRVELGHVRAAAGTPHSTTAAPTVAPIATPIATPGHQPSPAVTVASLRAKLHGRASPSVAERRISICSASSVATPTPLATVATAAADPTAAAQSARLAAAKPRRGEELLEAAVASNGNRGPSSRSLVAVDAHATRLRASLAVGHNGAAGSSASVYRSPLSSIQQNLPKAARTTATTTATTEADCATATIGLGMTGQAMGTRHAGFRVKDNAVHGAGGTSQGGGGRRGQQGRRSSAKTGGGGVSEAASGARVGPVTRLAASRMAAARYEQRAPAGQRDAAGEGAGPGTGARRGAPAGRISNDAVGRPAVAVKRIVRNEDVVEEKPVAKLAEISGRLRNTRKAKANDSKKAVSGGGMTIVAGTGVASEARMEAALVGLKEKKKKKKTTKNKPWV